ncbi:MAG: protein-glutamate O-methyltransferase CheR, partial [Chloroflexota bacterium]|nr:protein-glutamate O-methyltransferase CheR [Chloroflexota bacterium]
MSGSNPTTEPALEDLEVQLLLEGVFRWYGYDFRDYAPASLKRRILSRFAEEQVASVSELQAKVLHDPACMQRLLAGISVTVSSMFRDPDFYRVLRAKVLPLLRTYPFIRVWHAGCSTGEEVYSTAILLCEEGL